MKTAGMVLHEIRLWLEDAQYYTNPVDHQRFIRLISKEIKEYCSMSTSEAATQMAGFLREGLDVMDSIKALHGAKFDPDTVNKMMDDFGEEYNASPLEYQDNLNINRQDLIEKLENLYKGAE